MNFFNKESKLQKKIFFLFSGKGVGGGLELVSFFLTKNPNLKSNIFFFFLGGGGGGRGVVAGVSEFFLL